VRRDLSTKKNNGKINKYLDFYYENFLGQNRTQPLAIYETAGSQSLILARTV
jgi:hypothetical protein